jgi:2-polyprenyl-6-hydroxyphenyl methylase/3-demethylubiquinone-9 3-methyltransferase
VTVTVSRPRNDPGQYDDLAAEWWRPDGVFALLHWLARARAALIPSPPPEGGVLVDIGCGGGLLAPWVPHGYTHLGVDVTGSALRQARAHGVVVARGDATRLPLPDACAAVVCAGEILEHVVDLPGTLSEACRVLRPGGTLVLDTIAATRLARWLVIDVAERLPRGAPIGLHDAALFVDRAELVTECARHGVTLRLTGLRPAAGPLLRWLRGRPTPGGMRSTRWTSVLFQGVGVKAPA